MDGFTFVVEMTKAVISWPTAILVAIYFLKDHLGDLALNLKKVKYGGTEFEFGEAIEEVNQEVGPLTEDEAEQIPQDPKLLNLLESYPRLAIIEAWQRVDASLKRKFPPPGGGKPKAMYWQSILRDLEGTGNRDISLLYGRLRYLRNLAVHETEKQIDRADAYLFISMADLFMAEIKSIDTLPDPKRDD